MWNRVEEKLPEPRKWVWVEMMDDSPKQVSFIARIVILPDPLWPLRNREDKQKIVVIGTTGEYLKGVPIRWCDIMSPYKAEKLYAILQDRFPHTLTNEQQKAKQ